MKNVLRIRHLTSWYDKPLATGKTVQKCNLELSTNILSTGVRWLSWNLVGKFTICNILYDLIPGITAVSNHY